MNTTLQNLIYNIENTLEILDKVITLSLQYDIDDADEAKLNDMNAVLKTIKNNYIIISLDTLTNYISETDVEKKRISHNKFIQNIHTYNFASKIDWIKSEFQKILKKYDFDTTDSLIISTFNMLNLYHIHDTFNTSRSDICESCDIPFMIEDKTAEFACKNCGFIKKMNGVVFEDEQFFYQEGHRTKHGKYEPIKHAKIWLDRIQAKESIDIPISIINEIKVCIRNKNISIDIINCELIRQYLKDTSNSSYYNNAALIMKIITGKEPIQLTDNEIQLVYMYFSRAIQIFQKNNEYNDSNCPYHPYFIYKIIEQIVVNPERRKSILSCIHLQSRETLIKHDNEWTKICADIPEFKFIPTKKR